MTDLPCPSCAKPIPSGARFCPGCGRSATPPAAAMPAPPAGPAPAASTPPAPGAPGASSGGGIGCFRGCLILGGVIFVLGVAGQLGWDWWQGRQRQARADAFYALARPLLGTWKMVEGPAAARYTYTTRFRPNSGASLTGEAPETLFFDCVENPRAPQWTLSSIQEGRLAGGGVDQTPAADFAIALGTAEASADGQRLTLRMVWDRQREVVTVLERLAPGAAPPAAAGAPRP